jgi:hypothetical protein
VLSHVLSTGTSVTCRWVTGYPCLCPQQQSVQTVHTCRL